MTTSDPNKMYLRFIIDDSGGVMNISRKGRDWNGVALNEDNLLSGQLVMWRNKFYTTGNRRHELVELYRDNKFIRVVNCGYIFLCYPKC